jgi:hypothetical protein
MKPQTAVPHRMEPFGAVGWTVSMFPTAHDAAAFVLAHPQAAMPCWKRVDIINGALVLA